MWCVVFSHVRMAVPIHAIVFAQVDMSSPAATSGGLPAPRGQMCPKCTLENRVTESTCRACGFLLPLGHPQPTRPHGNQRFPMMPSGRVNGVQPPTLSYVGEYACFLW